MDFKDFQRQLERTVNRQHRRLIQRHRRLMQLRKATLIFGIVLAIVAVLIFLQFLR